MRKILVLLVLLAMLSRKENIMQYNMTPKWMQNTKVSIAPPPVVKKQSQNWMANPIVSGIPSMSLTQAITNPISQFNPNSYSPVTPDRFGSPIVSGLSAMPLTQAIANPISQFSLNSYNPTGFNTPTVAPRGGKGFQGIQSPTGPNIGTNPTPPDKGEVPPYNLGQDSAPFQAWYAIPDNAKYWDTLNDAERAVLVETLNNYGMTDVPGFSSEAIARSNDQYYLQQRKAENAAAMAAQAARDYYQSGDELGGKKEPFSSYYNGWGNYGGYGGGGGYAKSGLNWLTNLTNWNIA